MTEERWDAARLKALDRADGAEKRLYLVWVLLYAVDLAFIWGFITLSDFSNRIHVLIIWLALFMWVTLTISGFLLWGLIRKHMNRMTALVLKAIDLSTKQGDLMKIKGPPGR